MTDSPTAERPVPRWVHVLAVGTAAATLLLLVLGQLVTTFRAGMADPVWPTEPWYLVNNYKLDFGYLIEHAHRIAGFAVGMLSFAVVLGTWWSDPRPASRGAGLAALLTLFVAYGLFHRAMMAQRDAVHIEWPVPLIAAMGLCLAVLVGLGLAGMATRSRSAGVRLLAVAAFVAVMIQGLLGGFRVRLNELVGTDLAAVHGVFGQAVFALLVWVAAATARPAASGLAVSRLVRGGAVAVVGLLFVQLVWGAMVRHLPGGVAQQSAQRLHFLFAFLVLIGVLHLMRAVFADPAARRRFARLGVLMGVLVGVQVVLGVEAWMMKFGAYTLPELLPVTKGSAAVRTLHTVNGAILLAGTVLLAVRSRAARPPAAGAGEADGWRGGAALAAAGTTGETA